MPDPTHRRGSADPNTDASVGPDANLTRINAFAISLLRQDSLDNLLWSMVRNIGEAMSLEDCVLYLRRSEGFVQSAAHGPKNPEERFIKDRLVLQPGEGIVGSIAARGRGEIITDTREDDRYLSDVYAGRAEMAVPIIYHDEVIGVIDTEHSRPGAYDESDLELFTAFANIAAPRIGLALEEEQRRRAETELQEAKEQLERDVAARTEDLSRAVQQLTEEIAERRRAEAALSAERTRLAITLRSIGEGLLVADESGKVAFMSDAAEELLQRSRCDVIGKPIDEIYRTHASTASGGGPQGAHTDESITSRLRAHDAATPWRTRRRLDVDRDAAVWIDESGTALADGTGRYIGLVVVFRDVSRERELQAEAEKALKMESLAVLAGGIAHEFNNLLTSILGNVNLAQIEPTCPAGIRDSLDLVEGAATRARRLTTRLLTFSKGGAPVRERTPVGPLLDRALELPLDGVCDSVRFTLDVPDDLPDAFVDPAQIEQVLHSVLQNAVDAMPDGGLVVTRARPMTHDGTVGITLEIEDQGAGIDPEHLAQIFDPYFTTREYGSGLGLTSAYGIIQRHGGRLGVRSAPGEGTVVEVFLPANDVEDADRVRTMSSAPPLKVLVMDDDPGIRRSVARMLDSLGHEATAVTDGAGAIDAYAQSLNSPRKFDLVIMDLTIKGGMGGKVAVRALQKLDPEVVAVVASGYSNDPVLADYRSYGFLGRVRKPFGLKELDLMIHRLFGARAE